jgi:hemerythrin
VSPSTNVVDPALTKYIGTTFNTARLSGEAAARIRHELVDAQVEVLRMYIEKQSREHLVEALDRLIECTEASFRTEEALMECLTGRRDPPHCATHHEVLAQLASLRTSALDFDRGRLLAHLILVDRELTSHIAEAMAAPDCQPLQDLAERETSLDHS